MHWAAPADIKQWLKRLFSIRPLLLMLVLAGFLVSELRFDWIERSIGAVLVSTNAERPRSGAIWELGRQTTNAHRALEQIVTDRQTSQKVAHNATSLQEIVEHMAPDQWVMIPADRFRILYLNLPRDIAEQVVPAYAFLKLIQTRRWDRTFIEKEGRGLRIYLLDNANRVLRQFRISADQLLRLVHSETQVEETLEALMKFENRIYPADRFFDALNRLSEEVRRGVLQQPRTLIRQPGAITRVGISDEVMSGFIELGFEFDTGGRRFVIIHPGREWAVWRLRSLLEGRLPVVPGEAGK